LNLREGEGTVPGNAPPTATDVAAQAFDVVVDGISVRYAGGALFQDLDFALARAECTCLLGPSGVGKSTLLRVMAGLERPAAGSIRAGDGGPIAGRLAWMGQRDGLLPWLSVRDNVTLGARLRGQRRDLGRACALLRAVALEDRAGERPAVLSGGQRQRVALARTLMEDRPLVLMDEPFSALDAITRARLQELAARLLGGRTVLLVTHDPLEALRLGHRIHVMAGLPARIEPAIVPAGTPPRDLADPHLLALQAELLRRLANARDLAA
jgi:putative hydroxymethylpyrimidine transport system ATP-binding protein